VPLVVISPKLMHSCNHLKSTVEEWCTNLNYSSLPQDIPQSLQVIPQDLDVFERKMKLIQYRLKSGG
jgi:hypothetical protein